MGGRAEAGPTALVLGAGFSRAVAGSMPLTGDLREPLRAAVGQDPGPDVEAYLSYLSQAQPFLRQDENLANRALFLRAARAVNRVIEQASAAARSSPPPDWLCALALHARRTSSTVITFNYDDLLERVSVQMNLPAGFPVLKLHGSIDEVWDPTTREVRSTRHPAGFPAAWRESASDRDPDLAEPGRWEPFIVPPVSVKSAFYDVAQLRDRWLRAADRLRSATSVVLLGYSLPAADHATSFLIGRAIGGEDPPGVGVADLDAGPVVERLRVISGREAGWSATGTSSIADAVDELLRWDLRSAADELRRRVDAGDGHTTSSVQVTAALPPIGALGHPLLEPIDHRDLSSVTTVGGLVDLIDDLCAAPRPMIGERLVVGVDLPPPNHPAPSITLVPSAEDLRALVG